MVESSKTGGKITVVKDADIKGATGKSVVVKDAAGKSAVAKDAGVKGAAAKSTAAKSTAAKSTAGKSAAGKSTAGKSTGSRKAGSRRPGLQESIRKDLLDQLERMDVRGLQYTSLVNDYMQLWAIKEKLIADIEKRGVLVESMTGNGFMVTKKNDSVDQLTRVSTQMLKVLSEIGIKPGQLGVHDEEEL